MSKTLALQAIRTVQKLSKGPSAGECWEWPGRRTSDGYGLVVIVEEWGSRAYLVHRLAYEAVYGRLPQGSEVRHKCDNPPCWNPAHLVRGTHAENMQDMVKKGRVRNGSAAQKEGESG